MTVSTLQTLDHQAFDGCMARFEPFEARPHLAVACSGGPDSLALAVLAAGWAKVRKGRVTALIVDHGLRAEAMHEAAATRKRLAQTGIRAVILKGSIATPARDIQNAARDLRYRLLQDWCAEHRVLHLLVAHHREDQAETLLLRLGRGSGVDGLAAMAAESALDHVRLLRPLLEVPRDSLEVVARRAAGTYVDDASNRDPAFARVRMRRLLPALAAEGLTVERLSATAGRLGRARQALEQTVNVLLGKSVGLYPAGYCRIAPGVLFAAPEEVALRALSRIVACVSGAAHPPRLDRLERLYAALRDGSLGRGRTLAGVRVVQWQDAVLALRETAAMAPPVRLTGQVLWDGRYSTEAVASGWSLGALGSAGVAAVGEGIPAVGPVPPRLVWPTLPAFWRRGQPKVVPHLGILAPGRGAGASLQVVHAPKRPLGAAIFNFS